MTEEETRYVESSQRQHHESMLQQVRVSVAVESEEFNLFRLLKPSLKRDGNKWCVLYGDNLQEGVSGFGKSPYLAILDWTKEMHKEVPEK